MKNDNKKKTYQPPNEMNENIKKKPKQQQQIYWRSTIHIRLLSR